MPSLFNITLLTLPGVKTEGFTWNENGYMRNESYDYKNKEYC